MAEFHSVKVLYNLLKCAIIQKQNDIVHLELTKLYSKYLYYCFFFSEHDIHLVSHSSYLVSYEIYFVINII